MVTPDANRTGTGGQQVGLASAQKPDGHAVLKSRIQDHRKTMHSWIKTHFLNGMIWHNIVDILHSSRQGMEMDVPPLWFSNCVRDSNRESVPLLKDTRQWHFSRSYINRDVERSSADTYITSSQETINKPT